MEDKIAAIKAVAEAYFQRGTYIQYDQRFLNRSGSVREERRRKGKEPEYATSQTPLHLDCSSFVWSSFYQTFGIKLKGDQTDAMIELKDIRAFYYEITGKETEKEKKEIIEKVRAEIRPGDAFVTRQAGEGNGHIVLYVGDGNIVHCSYKKVLGGGGDYDYEKKFDNFEPTGGIFKDSFEDYFDESTPRYLFSGKQHRFAILRPINEKTTVTPNAKARLKGLCGISVEKTCSKKPSQTVSEGETLEYFISVRNFSTEYKEAVITDKAPEGTESTQKLSWKLSLSPLEVRRVSYTVKVKKGCPEVIRSDATKVNGVKMNTIETLVGKNLTAEQKSSVAEAAKKTRAKGWNLAKTIYKNALGADLPCRDTDELINEMTQPSKIDTQIVIKDRKGAVRSMLVPYLYGGKNMETNRAFPIFRVREVRPSDFEIGDVLVFADEKDIKVFVCSGESSFVGENGKTVSGKDAFDLTQTLFGQFMFFVLRPSMAL